MANCLPHLGGAVSTSPLDCRIGKAAQHCAAGAAGALGLGIDLGQELVGHGNHNFGHVAKYTRVYRRNWRSRGNGGGLHPAEPDVTEQGVQVTNVDESMRG